MTPTNFRCLVLCSVLLAIVSSAVDWLFPSLISQALTTALEREPLSAFIMDHPFILLAVLLPWLAAVLASTIGLLFFKRWARTVALYSTILGIGLYPLFGVTVASAVASSFSEASMLVWGAVLALAYYSSLSERFVAAKPKE
jgi:hypothetical protein